ncbi:unnamed protein product [Gordionus sp. m RMFG-2023]
MTFQNNSTHERRVRQIYDSLDSGNPKKAIQEADKLLKKQKDALDAKALKALAYIRLCKFKECTEILNELEADKPTEDSTLHALSLCFRELNKPSDLARILEHATQKCPGVEELWTNLYFAYVRTQDFKAQYKVALALYKSASNGPGQVGSGHKGFGQDGPGKAKRVYLQWAVVSLVLQALADPVKAKSIYLPLAHKMLLTKSASAINPKSNLLNATVDQKSLSDIELDLLSIILEMSSNWQEAMDLFTSPTGSKIRYGDITAKEKIAQIYHKMENFEMANQCYQELIKEQPDNWNFYEKYLDTLFFIADDEMFKDCLGTLRHKKTIVQKHKILKTTQASRLPSSSALQTAGQFLNGVIAWSVTRSVKRRRAPHMAKLDLALRCCVVNGRGGQMEHLDQADPTALVIEYIDMFGSKPCCFWDLEYFLCVPAFKSLVLFKEVFVTKMESTFHDLVSNNQEESKAISKRLNILYTFYKLGKYMGYFDDPVSLNPGVIMNSENTTPRLDICKRLVSLYFNATREQVSTVDNRNFLLLSACDCLFDIWTEITTPKDDDRIPNSPITTTTNFDYLKQALILMEHALQNENTAQANTSLEADKSQINDITGNGAVNEYKDTGMCDTSSSEAQIRLALIKLYYLIGVPSMCLEHFHSIDAKFIQYDTLGNFVIYPAFAFAHFSSLKTCFENIIKFYENSYKNIWDYSVTVVKVNFFQIYDFVDFKRHLTHSLTRHFISVESILLDLLTEADNYELVEEILDSVPLKNLQDLEIDRFCDNTDYYILDNYQSNQKLDYEKVIEENGYQEKQWITLRNRILHTLTICTVMGSDKYASQTRQSSNLSHQPGRPTRPLPYPKNDPKFGETPEFLAHYKKECIFKSLVITFVDILIQRREMALYFAHSKDNTDKESDRDDSHPSANQTPNSRNEDLKFQKYRLYGPFPSNLPIYHFSDGLYLNPIINCVSLAIVINFILYNPSSNHTTPDHVDRPKDECENNSDNQMIDLLRNFKGVRLVSFSKDDTKLASNEDQNLETKNSQPTELLDTDNNRLYEIIEKMMFPNDNNAAIINSKEIGDLNLKRQDKNIRAIYKQNIEHIKSSFQTITKFITDDYKDKIQFSSVSSLPRLHEISQGFPTYFNYNQRSNHAATLSNHNHCNNLKSSTNKIDSDNFILETASKIYHLRFVVETYGLTCLYLGSIYRLLQPVKIRANKKMQSKKKQIPHGSNKADKDGANYFEDSEMINQLYEDIRVLLVHLNVRVYTDLSCAIKMIAFDINTYLEQNQSFAHPDHPSSPSAEEPLNEIVNAFELGSLGNILEVIFGSSHIIGSSLVV